MTHRSRSRGQGKQFRGSGGFREVPIPAGTPLIIEHRLLGAADHRRPRPPDRDVDAEVLVRLWLAWVLASTLSNLGVELRAFGFIDNFHALRATYTTMAVKGRPVVRPCRQSG